MRISENRRLIGLVSVLLVAGFMAISLTSYYVSKKAVRESIAGRELPLTSDTIYSEIQRDILRPIFISSLMASDTFLRDWALGGERDTAAVTKYLKEIMDRYGAVTSFFISERTQVYYHASGPFKKVSETDPRDAWYFRVRAMDGPYEINVDPDHVNRETMTIFINYRVLDYDGRFIGVTGVGLTVDTARALIENYQRRYQRNVFFVNHEGEVTLKGRGVNGGFHALKDDPGYRAIAGAILSGQQGGFEYGRDRQTVLVTSRFIPELNWFLLVEQVEDPSLTAHRRALAGSLLVSLVITIIVLAAISYTVNFYQRRLEKMATVDKLTGLWNRQAFEMIFNQVAKETRRSGQALSVAILDVDHFKNINDTYGHMTGDEAIKSVAATMVHNVRASDVTCRWGGEEFLALLRDCDGEQAYALAEKIRVAMEQTPFTSEGKSTVMTASLGVAQYRPGEDLDALLRRADKALYAAKQGGRNRAQRGD